MIAIFFSYGVICVSILFVMAVIKGIEILDKILT